MTNALAFCSAVFSLTIFIKLARFISNGVAGFMTMDLTDFSNFEVCLSTSLATSFLNLASLMLIVVVFDASDDVDDVELALVVDGVGVLDNFGDLLSLLAFRAC
ncbi:MAG: hypothetical protein ACOYB2_19895 [Limnohabitans sp.]